MIAEAASFTGQLRRAVTDSAILATISTENGGVLRHDERTIEIVLVPTITAGLSPGSVTLDLVRTDLDPDRHLGVLLAEGANRASSVPGSKPRRNALL